MDRPADDVDADPLVLVVGVEAVERLRGAQKRHAAARHDALFDRGAGGVQGVVDPIFALLHLDSVAPPTRMTATPPASFASRSCSFSLS